MVALLIQSYNISELYRFKLSGAFSGLLAAAIQNMDGIGGRPGWAWIFILVSGPICTPIDALCLRVF